MKTNISVIIPVYNAEKFIRKCVESILAQTYRDFELIMVDDGSKDDSLAICKELQQHDNRIRVFSKKNGGPSSARKLGVEKAEGEFVFFVDADDMIPCDALEMLWKRGQMESLDIIQGARRFIPTDGSEERISDFKTEEVIDSKTYIRYLFQGYANAGPVATLYRRSLFRSETFDLPDDVRVGEDFYMNLCLGMKSKRIGLCNVIVYDYIENRNSVTHNYIFRSLTPQINLLESIRRELIRNDWFSEFTDLYFQNAISTLASACFHNRKLLYDKYCNQIVKESENASLSPRNKALRYMLKFPLLYDFFYLANRIRQMLI